MSICALCGSSEQLSVYEVQPVRSFPNKVILCQTCLDQIERKTELKPDYWHFLSDAMWSEEPAVQVIAWRMLNRLKTETWAADLLDMLYLDEELLDWAKALGEEDEPIAALEHKDSLGNVLNHGDSVVLTKTLDVKGSSINARIGTVVKNIRLVEDNPEQIEGKIDGQLIVILTKYLKKQNG
ncbi:PhnA domain-containing protein [Siphonobacter sp. SORGH_AS_0500]|uniref:PhnA domain-containing protein n=1 Tax=Siphonobacter sp. SORGH_AS_0500 TaxID=1864824 RepID=UPI002854FD1D|nr:PhnA domain-containing protein [Siphonobacter sp. SORGH_AS_0500]MDR6195002.1 protein PhnA [Siphonobacter sp. SORGH_AS_0500]